MTTDHSAATVLHKPPANSGCLGPLERGGAGVDPRPEVAWPEFELNSTGVGGDWLVPREGFEPPTYCLEGSCSVH